jgi:hypothetical protein
MANTQVVPFKDSALPAHIAKFVEEQSNIDPKNVLNQLSFRGKVWRQVIDGEERPLLNKEDEPVSTVHVVILNHNKARSRAYYEGAYVEGKSQPPACWSMDGETPDETVKEPVCATCGKCPNAVKGSKITSNGAQTTLCSVFKRLVVVPLSDLECKPMLLRLAQTSMWDKNNEENESKGYYAWDQYLDMLRARGATHTGVVATKIRFDSRMAYPKLVFAASRWLEPEEIAQVSPLFESEEVDKLLNTSEIAAAQRKPKKDDDEEPEEEAPKAKGKKAAATPPEDEEGEDEETPPPKKAKAAAPPPAEDDDDEPAPPPKKAKAKAAPAPAEDDDEPAPPPKTKKAKAAPVEDDDEPAPAAKPAAKKGGKDNGLGDLVSEWDD